MKQRATCILPKPDRTPEITFDTKDHEVWLGDAEGGMRVLFCLTEISFRKMTSTILDYI